MKNKWLEQNCCEFCGDYCDQDNQYGPDDLLLCRECHDRFYGLVAFLCLGGGPELLERVETRLMEEQG